MHRLRIKPGEQREVADYHQPLNMVGISSAERLADGVCETAHFGFASPEPGRQRQLVVEEILRLVARHVGPIHTAHILRASREICRMKPSAAASVTWPDS